VSRTAIVTDSTADLAPAAAAAAGIRVVPLHVQFDQDSFLVGVDLTTEQFWERLLAPGAPIPSTASPSPGSFMEAFEASFAEGADGIVCLVIGSQISSTFQGATVAAQLLPGREIHVIDTGSTSMATGIPAEMAAAMAATGMPAAEIAAAIRGRLPDVDLFVAVDTLEYLRKHGRLSAARSAIGTMLSIKPIITVRDGLIVVADQQRSRMRARRRVIELIAERPLERLAIMHTPTSTPEEVAIFRDALVEQLPGGIDPSRVSVGLLGASTGPHLGPDLIGACFLRRH
jgi:DegV family protein with EDD domain